jgi:hypothetical protein
VRGRRAAGPQCFSCPESAAGKFAATDDFYVFDLQDAV